MVVAAPDSGASLVIFVSRTQPIGAENSRCYPIGALARREQLMPRCLAIFERLLRTVEQLG